jgi:hypothetical protein
MNLGRAYGMLAWARHDAVVPLCFPWPYRGGAKALLLNVVSVPKGHI